MKLEIAFIKILFLIGVVLYQGMSFMTIASTSKPHAGVVTLVGGGNNLTASHLLQAIQFRQLDRADWGE